MGGGVPQAGAHDGAGALEVDGFDGNDENGARPLSLHFQPGQQILIDADNGAAIDAQGIAMAGNARVLGELLSMLDTFDFWFNIVTPVDALPG